MKKTRKKPDFGTWFGILCFAALGAVVGMLYLRYILPAIDAGMPKGQRIWSVLLLAAFLYGSLFLQLILHEAGHLVFGLASGYRFSSFRVFQFMWLREEDGRVRLKKMGLAGTAGQCLMSPPDFKDGRIPVMLYNFGGALMNALTALLALCVGLLFPAESLARLGLMVFCAVGVMFALLNGLPMRTGLVSNDGRNALDIARDPAAMRAFWVQLRMNEEVSRGVRQKDMPAEWFQVPPDEEMKNGITAALGVFACGRLMDEHRFGEADALMRPLLCMDSIPGLYKGLMRCDRMYVELITKNRPEALRGMRSKEQMKFMKAMARYPSVLRTEYAYALLAEKDGEKAAALRDKLEKQLAAYPYPGEAEAEREFADIAADKEKQHELPETV